MDRSQYYFRVTLHFETNDPKHSWPYEAVGMGSATRLERAVVRDSFLVK